MNIKCRKRVTEGNGPKDSASERKNGTPRTLWSISPKELLKLNQIENIEVPFNSFKIKRFLVCKKIKHYRPIFRFKLYK